MSADERDTKEMLIIAGIEELDENGITNFSVRRIASKCSLSCAAPYKHFKNKSDYLLAIQRYVNKKWYNVQSEAIRTCRGGSLDKLAAISVAYVRFLAENTTFRTVIMMSEDKLSPEQRREKNANSELLQEYIELYCSEIGMTSYERAKKTFIVYSVIYGAAMMIDARDYEASEAAYGIVHDAVIAEFRVPQ